MISFHNHRDVPGALHICDNGRDIKSKCLRHDEKYHALVATRAICTRLESRITSAFKKKIEKRWRRFAFYTPAPVSTNCFHFRNPYPHRNVSQQLAIVVCIELRADCVEVVPSGDMMVHNFLPTPCLRQCVQAITNLKK